MLAAAAKLEDAEASNEMLRIYNDLMIDFCRHYPERISAWPACRSATSTPP